MTAGFPLGYHELRTEDAGTTTSGAGQLERGSGDALSATDTGLREARNEVHDTMIDTAKTQSSPRGERVGAARLSLITNLLLSVLKIIVGLLTGSVSILAEAAHSLSDLLASGLTLVSIHAADRPPDRSHPYGHGKAESLSAMAEALLLFVAALFIVCEAISKFLAHAKPARVDWGIAVMAASALINVFVVRSMLAVARRSGSQALRADAENHRADIYAASGVFLGLVLVRLTGRGFFDPLLAILVALLIFRAAWSLADGALAPLMDSQLPAVDVEKVRRVLEEDPSVLAYHKLRTRQSGAERFVDAHILMDDDLTLAEAHELTEDVEEKVRAALPNTEVTLHTEPYRAERQHQHEHHDGPPVEDAHPCELDQDR